MSSGPWRAAAVSLAGTTVVFGAFLALSGGSRTAPPRPDEIEVTAQVADGPRPGDLRSLLEPARPQTPEPSPVVIGDTRAPRPASGARARTAVRPAPPRPSTNPFRNLPGAGVLGDMCSGGRC